MKKSAARIGREAVKSKPLEKSPVKPRPSSARTVPKQSPQVVEKPVHKPARHLESRPVQPQKPKEVILPITLPHKERVAHQNKALIEHTIQSPEPTPILPPLPAVETAALLPGIMPETDITIEEHPFANLFEEYLDANKSEIETGQTTTTAVAEWVASLPETALEHIGLSNILDIPLPASPDVIAAMIEQNPEAVPTLPPVCAEVTQAVQELAPELAGIALEKMQTISALVDEVVMARMENNEIAPELEQELAKLCMQLFEYLGIEYTPETAIEFTIGVAQTKKFIAFLNAKSEEWIDKSMREALPGAQQTNVLQPARPFTQQLGSLTLRLTQALAA